MGMTMELQASETRTQILTDGSTVTMSWTAGGSFCQVQHRAADGALIYNRNHVSSWTAAQDWERLTGAYARLAR